MNRRLPALFAPLLVVAALGCNDSTAPETTSCATTRTVDITTTKTATGMVINWSPGCSAAMVLVEEGGSDMWYAIAPDLDENSTEASNIIKPSVTYGQVPAGAEGSPETQTLVAGRTYEIVIWRVVAPGATATCHERFGNACLIGLEQFVY